MPPRCVSNGDARMTFVGQYHRLALRTSYCPLSARHVKKKTHVKTQVDD